MRCIALCGSGIGADLPYVEALDVVDFEGASLTFALVRANDPAFDPKSEDYAQHVLVRVHAFSCNYRDKAIVLRAAREGTPLSVFPVGSEFAGEVEAAGSAVHDLEVGDRVMANGCWPSETEGTEDGLPTNSASRERLVIHRAKLCKVPASMSNEVAASFQIGGQTSYGMIRRLSVAPNDKVWVTSARSNTSLFAIRAARNAGARVWASTTSKRNERELRNLGIEELIPIDTSVEPDAAEPLLTIAHRIGGFDAVIDPLFDMHLDRAVEVLRNDGRYATCGLLAQDDHLIDRTSRRQLDLLDIMTKVTFKSLQIFGNCLGTTDDLLRSVDDYAEGLLDVTIDSVFSGTEVREFLERTYFAPDRFGKVLFRYD